MFGSSKPAKPPAPTVDQAIQKNKQVLEQMDKKLLLLNHNYEQTKQNAKKLHAASRGKKDNPRLTAALKKMKQIEGQIGTLEAQRSNLEAQMTTLDNLEMNKMMVDAVNTANVAAKAAMEGSLNPDQVADVVDDAADIQEDMEEVATVLAEPMGANALLDEDDLYDEFLADLEDEEGLGEQTTTQPVLPQVSNVSPFPEVATGPIAAPAAAAEDDEDEFARLEAEFMG